LPLLFLGEIDKEFEAFFKEIDEIEKSVVQVEKVVRDMDEYTKTLGG
jgi:hypothetical protein